jgi:hypothetical protein
MAGGLGTSISTDKVVELCQQEFVRGGRTKDPYAGTPVSIG